MTDASQEGTLFDACYDAASNTISDLFELGPNHVQIVQECVIATLDVVAKRGYPINPLTYERMESLAMLGDAKRFRIVSDSATGEAEE